MVMPTRGQRTAKNKMKKVMGEYKEGTLHSGKGGPVVKSRDQAIAIALSQANKANPAKAKKKSKQA
jgi:preprotein translocase subunit YajC